MEVLRRDIVLSKAFAKGEVERFTFRMPGEAVSATTASPGSSKSARPRESRGPGFSFQAFHDFILSQGLVPPNLLRKVVMEDFVR